MSDVLLLADHATRDDLRVYLERLSRTGLPDVRLVSRGDVLAVFGCTQAPEGLLDQVPVVLVLRSFALAADSAPGGARGIDRVVPARGLLDRLARLGLVGLTLELPDVESNAAWAGVLPPAGGWQDAGAVDAASLARVAEEGIRRTAEALPDSPGEAVVRRVRTGVWGAEIAPGLPAAVAFAAEAMGFLPAVDDAGDAAGEDAAAGSSPTGSASAGSASSAPVMRLSTTLTWRRLANERGEVLVRTLLG
ncbi:hypothetical protein ACFPZL_09775 [Leucobacter soli]|uniref:Uncharacterized protein n=1 Tax=Leucobacter soli TaxID=2812850 RepID=A0A916NI89_9MICO|nr:hypothetical protein [Leucobacter soli]CAG7615008.1 hypothetical protein LEUCIP111803_01836 [Leucobacter soli]